jgi:chorismate mutase
MKLLRRMEIARKIGAYKREHNVMALQLLRWEQILRRRGIMAKSVGLDADFIRKIFTLIHEESLNIQTDVMTA